MEREGWPPTKNNFFLKKRYHGLGHARAHKDACSSEARNPIIEKPVKLSGINQAKHAKGNTTLKIDCYDEIIA